MFLKPVLPDVFSSHNKNFELSWRRRKPCQSNARLTKLPIETSTQPPRKRQKMTCKPEMFENMFPSLASPRLTSPVAPLLEVGRDGELPRLLPGRTTLAPDAQRVAAEQLDAIHGGVVHGALRLHLRQRSNIEDFMRDDFKQYSMEYRKEDTNVKERNKWRDEF